MRFLLIDRIIAWEPGKSARAIKNIALSEDFFDDHFPTKPIVPGVLLIEGMAQLAGLLIEEGVRRDEKRNVKALLSIVEKAKFRKPVYPGDSLVYEAKVLSVNEIGGRAEANAQIGGEQTASCSLVFTFHEFTNADMETRRAGILNNWLRGLPGHE